MHRADQALLVDPSWTIAKLDAEIQRCLNGSERQGYQHGEDIMWLMGWADLSIERELMLEHFPLDRSRSPV